MFHLCVSPGGSLTRSLQECPLPLGGTPTTAPPTPCSSEFNWHTARCPWPLLHFVSIQGAGKANSDCLAAPLTAVCSERYHTQEDRVLGFQSF